MWFVLLSNKVYMFDMREFFCIRCSVFEEDEETPSWKAGRSVARCEACFRFCFVHTGWCAQGFLFGYYLIH